MLGDPAKPNQHRQSEAARTERAAPEKRIQQIASAGDDVTVRVHTQEEGWGGVTFKLFKYMLA